MRLGPTSRTGWFVVVAIVAANAASAAAQLAPREALGVPVPADMPRLVPSVNEKSAEGKLFIGTNSGPGYLLVFENDGTPYFYRQLASPTYDFKIQPAGVLSYWEGPPLNGWVTLDHTFTPIDTLRGTSQYETNHHGFQLLPDGHALFIVDEKRQRDMSEVIYGGYPDAVILGQHVQELDADGNLVMEWRSWDHFEITDTWQRLTSANIDYVHMNSVGVDFDGHIIVSSRHLNECTKFHRQTGKIIWRLGGKNNQFEFVNDPGMFSTQHDFRAVPGKPHHYTLFDNGVQHEPPRSRAVEYRLDLNAGTAEKVWEYVPEPFILSGTMGSVQRLPNSNTLINWAHPGLPKVTEVDPSGSVVYEADLDDSPKVYRAFRFPLAAVAPAPHLTVEPGPEGVHLVFERFGATDVDHYRVYGGGGRRADDLIATTKERSIFLAPSDLSASALYSIKITAIDEQGRESAESALHTFVNHFPGRGGNQIVNGSFSGGTDNWQLSVNDPARAQVIEHPEGGLAVEIEQGSESPWHVTLEQESLGLERDGEYELRFVASAETDYIMQVRIAEPCPPCVHYTDMGYLLLGPQPERFAHRFTMEKTTTFSAELHMLLGSAATTVYVDSVSLRRLDRQPTSVTGPSAPAEAPGFEVAPAYPNPFNGSTRLAFALPEASLVNLAVYNMLGQLSLRLPEQRFSAGRHEIRLDKQLGGSGVYLLRLEAQSESGAQFVATRRTLMLH